MEEIYLSAFDSWRKFDHNMCEGIECQTLDLNIMSFYFVNDMFDIIKRQKDFSFYLAMFQIEATRYFFLKIKFKVKLFLHIYKIRRVLRACIFNVNG